MRGYSLEENARIASARVHVERFFGRMKCSWKILATKYRRSPRCFDQDFDILVALTNRLILCRPQPTERENKRYLNVHASLRQQHLLAYEQKIARISEMRRLRPEKELSGQQVQEAEEEFSEEETEEEPDAPE